MMRKILIFVFTLVASLSFVNTSLAEEETSTWSIETWNVEITHTYYHWEWCSYCGVVDAFLTRNNAYEILNIEKKEVWNNDENRKEFLEAGKRLWLPESQIWSVPLFVIKEWENETALLWDKDIINYVKSSIWDVGESWINGKKITLLVVFILFAIFLPLSLINLSNKKS